MEIETLTVPDWYYFYRGEQLPEDIILRQLERFPMPDPEDGLPGSSDASLLPFSRKPQEPKPKKEDWFPDW